ncbi:MAG: porin [Gammaproteobacteria bacterium]|mgnify:CR=1 FL=1|nr:MAG: porin [Gammaproteobacteria bacterium]
MNKFLPVVIGTGLLVTGSAFAADIPAPTLYGRVHVSVGMIDNDDGSATQVKSNASRFGMKGKYDIDAGLAATYKLEFEVDTTDDTATSIKKGRTQYAGLKGSFGEIRVGRHDTAYKWSTAKFDPWGDTYADYNNILDKDEHDARENNSIVYVNKFDAFSLAASYSAGSDDIAGDNDGSRVSIGGMYKAGGLMIGGGFEDVDAASSAFKLGASYSFDAFKLGGVVESVDKETAGTDELNLFITGEFKLSKEGSIKAVFGQTDIDASSAEDPTMFAIGYNHKFNKKASAYVLFVSGDDEGMDEAGGVDGDATAFALGLKYNF